VWLARHGASVLAVDVSEGMVEQARERVIREKLGAQVEVRRLAIENLATLLPEHARAFDIVLCNFGALNMAGDPAAWGPVVARLLKPEGRLIATVMTRWCLPEIAASILRLRPSFALRRARGAPIDVGGVPLTARMYSPGEFARRLRGHFEPISVRGLCVAFPPPTLETAAGRLTGSRTLRLADRVLGRLPGLRGLGDHFLVVLRPNMGGHLLFEAGAPITASPVVADLNGDGAPEVIVAADRLWVLDAQGEPLHGWPRRASKPIASTAAVVREGESTRIYAGSDDHKLHGFELTGRRLAGFPYPTAGDVFSSPWVGALTPGGDRSLVFGSDDGFVYAIDERGCLRPAWPVQTGAYVSASPAIANTSGGPAVFIGSWDGHLYGVGAAGEALPGWPQRLGFPIWSTAAVADVDGDGHAEVVVAAHRLFAFRGNGDALEGFPVRLGGYAVGSATIGDIDGDGRPEIVIASDRVYAVRGDGSTVEGFPVDVRAHVWASPLLVDVDGDGRPEVVVADMKGNVWAIDGRGRVLDGWPKRSGKRVAASSAAADVDNDGYLEILVATWEGRVIVYQTEARADAYVASPWRSFPHRNVPETPLISTRPASPPPHVAAHALSSQGEGAGGEVSSPAIWTEPSVPRPFRVTDVHLSLWGDLDVEAGLLYYELDGKLHPSPLLGRGGRYFGIVQPLRPFKTIDLHFELLMASGETVRMPSSGAYRMTVGRPGLRHTEDD
jgi:SAM-dependent methyltransferase